MLELMEGDVSWSFEKENLCTARKLPGLSFGTSESGDDWKGPMRSSTSLHEYGPKYQPDQNSLLMFSRLHGKEKWTYGC